MRSTPDSRLVAVTHVAPPALERGERSYVDRTPIDLPLALAQHAAYCDHLLACGCDVVTLNVNRDYADAVFVEDTALVLDELAIITSPGAVTRRGETAGIELELRKYREIRRIELPATLDGGDVFVSGRTIFVGASERTNVEGTDALAAITHPLGYTVRRVGLRDCLHLKSAGCPLPDGRLLVNPAWIETAALRGFDLVPIPPEEPFAADVLAIGSTVILSASHPRTAALVRKLGFVVREAEVSEFEKAEGGVTCLSLIFSVPTQ